MIPLHLDADPPSYAHDNAPPPYHTITQTFVRGDSFVPRGASASDGPQRGGAFTDPADEAQSAVYRLGGAGGGAAGAAAATALPSSSSAAAAASSLALSTASGGSAGRGAGAGRGKNRQIDAFLEELKSKQERRDYYGRDRGDRENEGDKDSKGGWDRRPAEMDDPGFKVRKSGVTAGGLELCRDRCGSIVGVAFWHARFNPPHPPKP